MSNKSLIYDDGIRLRPLTDTRAFAAYYGTTYIGIIPYNGYVHLAANSTMVLNFNTYLILSNGAGTIGTLANVGSNFLLTVHPTTSLHSLVITSNSNYNKNHDHAAQTNPTLFVHSATDPDADNTQWLGFTHDQTNGVISWGKGELSLTGPTASLTLTKTGGTELADAIVKPATLKTATGEVSTTSTSGQSLVLPGGEYGFYPQVKRGSNPYTMSAKIAEAYNGDSYATIIHLTSSDIASTAYAQQRYVTASGLDHWLFCLVDKLTGKIVSAYSAPDHPAYNNGGNVDSIQHPFPGYNDAIYDLVILDNASIAVLNDKKQNSKKSLLEILNDEFVVDLTKSKTYLPLHTGEFLTVEKLVDTVVVVDIDNPAFDKAKPAEEQKDVPEKIGQEQLVKVLKPFQEPVKLPTLPEFISVRAIKTKT